MIRIAVLVVSIFLLEACVSVGKYSQNKARKKETVELYVKLGLGYMRQGQVKIAITKFERALSIKSTSVIAHTSMAMAYTQIGRFSLAEKHFEIAVKHGPKDASANYNYGVFLCSLKKIQIGLKHFKIALSDSKYKTPEKSYLEMGKCVIMENNKQQAEYYFLQALQRNRIMSAALFEMTKLHFVNRNYVQAEKYFISFFDVGQFDPNSLWLGIQIERKLNNSRLEQHYIRVLSKRFPESKIANEISGSKLVQPKIRDNSNAIDQRKTKDEKEKERLRKIDRLIDKYPLPSNYQNPVPSKGKAVFISKPSNSYSESMQPIGARTTAIEGMELIDYLIEQRQIQSKQKSTPAPQENKIYATEQSETDNDFMELME